MKRRAMLAAPLAIAALGAIEAIAAVKHPFEIRVRPVDNGYILQLVDTNYAQQDPPAITNSEVFAPDSSQASAILKLWLEAIRALP